VTDSHDEPMYIDPEMGIVLTGTLHDDDFDSGSILRPAILRWRGLTSELASKTGCEWMAKAYTPDEMQGIADACWGLRDATTTLIQALRLYEKFWLDIEDVNDRRRAREQEQREESE